MGMAFCAVSIATHWLCFIFIFGRTVSKRKMEKHNGKELNAFKQLIDDQIKSFDKHNYGTSNELVTTHHDLVRMLLMNQDGF